jgi:hypothetical protein
MLPFLLRMPLPPLLSSPSVSVNSVRLSVLSAPRGCEESSRGNTSKQTPSLSYHTAHQVNTSLQASHSTPSSSAPSPTRLDSGIFWDGVPGWFTFVATMCGHRNHRSWCQINIYSINVSRGWFTPLLLCVLTRWSVSLPQGNYFYLPKSLGQRNWTNHFQMPPILSLHFGRGKVVGRNPCFNLVKFSC